jgi:hypothetical protein
MRIYFVIKNYMYTQTNLTLQKSINYIDMFEFYNKYLNYYRRYLLYKSSSNMRLQRPMGSFI